MKTNGQLKKPKRQRCASCATKSKKGARFCRACGHEMPTRPIMKAAGPTYADPRLAVFKAVSAGFKPVRDHLDQVGRGIEELVAVAQAGPVLQQLGSSDPTDRARAWDRLSYRY